MGKRPPNSIEPYGGEPVPFWMYGVLLAVPAVLQVLMWVAE